MKDLSHLGTAGYLEIVWRHRWYFILTAVLVALGSYVYTLRSPDVFKSESRVMVDTALVSEDYVRPSVKESIEDLINSIREHLASRQFLESMIQRYQLDGYGVRSDFIMEDAINLARKQIAIERSSNNTFTLSYIATDPHFAQKITKELAAELIRTSMASRKNKTVATSEFVDVQLKQTVEALAAQEEKIKQFKTAHPRALPEQSSANLNALSGLQVQLISTENSLQQARSQTRLLLSRSMAAQNAVKTPEKPEKKEKEREPSALERELAARRVLLTQYLEKYTPNHPDVVALTESINKLEQQVLKQQVNSSRPVDPEIAPLPNRPAADPVATELQFEMETLRTEVEKRANEKKEILARIDAIQKALNLAPSLEQELSGLLRDQNALKIQYENLQKQKFTAQMAEAVEIDKKNESYKIIDEANLPVRAQYPNRIQIILIGILGGLLLGTGAAIGRGLIDSTMGSEEEATLVLNAPVLVSIPRLPGERKLNRMCGKRTA